LLFADEAAASGWAAEWQATPALQEAYDKNRYAAAKYTWQPRSTIRSSAVAASHRRADACHLGRGGSLDPAAACRGPGPEIRGAERTMLPQCGHLLDIDARSFLPTLSPAFIERLRS